MLERAQNFLGSGFIGLWVLGSGRAQVSQICSQACRALQVIDEIIVIFVIEPQLAFKKPRELLRKLGLGFIGLLAYVVPAQHGIGPF